MKRIDKLTPEQEESLPAWRDAWLQHGLSTEPADRPRAEAALRFMYREIGETEPFVLWLDSPASALLAVAVFKNAKPLGDQLGDQLRGQLGDQLWAQLGAQLRAQLGAQLGDQLGDQLGAQLGDQLWAQLGDQLRGQLGDQLRAQLGDQLWAHRRAHLPEIYDATWWGYGDFIGSWSWWVPFYVYPRDVLGLKYVTKEDARLNAWAELMQSSGWWMPLKGMVIACERPSAITRDDRGRLHCEDGPALAFRDGYGLYAWHGVRLPAQVIESPDSLTHEQILGEPNAEVRRVMITRYGAERLMRDAKAKRLHVDDWGTLWRLDLQGDEALVCVEVVNSTAEPDGSWSRYWLRVPPTMKTAKEAVLWTHDLPETAQPVAMT